MIYFTSDLHLGHRAMAWLRKTGSWPVGDERSLITPEMVAEHDAMLAERWDATVSTNDLVWVLGDLTISAKDVDYATNWIMQRPGTKHLILGNHDPAHPMHSDSYKWQWRYLDAFSSVQTMGKRKINGQYVLLSHYPYEGDGDLKEDRDVQWRLRNQGWPVLHGHVHSKDRVTWAHLDRFGVPTEEKVQQIHVGVDAWNFTPVSLETIQGLISGGVV